MQKELSIFTAFALQNPHETVETLWNRFIQAVPAEKVKQVSEHHVLFLQTATQARFAPDSVKKLLQNIKTG